MVYSWALYIRSGVENKHNSSTMFPDVLWKHERMDRHMGRGESAIVTKHRTIWQVCISQHPVLKTSDTADLLQYTSRYLFSFKGRTNAPRVYGTQVSHEKGGGQAKKQTFPHVVHTGCTI